jgi:branched-chain amino acid transport system substrate-binding protein
MKIRIPKLLSATRVLWIGSLSAILGIGALAVAGLVQQRELIPVAIGIDLPLTPGAAIDPSDRNTADFYKEEHPGSPIQIHSSYNSPDPSRAPADLRQAMDKGVRFFVNTQASSHAVNCLELFASDRALSINVSATSARLSNRDDYFLRLIPDLVSEQKFIASKVASLKGRRLLVLQDTSNLAYTQPALQVFRRQLGSNSQWQLQVQQLNFTDYLPRQVEALMQQSWDGLYILGGSFLPSIGNMAQQFHFAHPRAPIVLTPWARSAMVMNHAGEAANQIIQVSPYLDASRSLALENYLQRFQARFGYEPYAMSLGTRQALELLDQAFSHGHRTPAAVKHYLLSKPVHHTSLGWISFNRFGDSEGKLYAYSPTPGQPVASQDQP